MKKFFGEFKKFITRGNVFDMAVGLIIATAFNKIVSSMVNDLIMPLIISRFLILLITRQSITRLRQLQLEP